MTGEAVRWCQRRLASAESSVSAALLLETDSTVRLLFMKSKPRDVEFRAVFFSSRSQIQTRPDVQTPRNPVVTWGAAAITPPREIKVTGGLSQAQTVLKTNSSEVSRWVDVQDRSCRKDPQWCQSWRCAETTGRRGSALLTQRGRFFRSPSSRWRRTLFVVVNSSLSSCTAVLPQRLSSSNKVSNKLGRAPLSLLLSPLPADF